MTHLNENSGHALGKREDAAQEAQTLAQFLQRARALGFTGDELARLRMTYGRDMGVDHDEHFPGVPKD